MHTIKFMSSRVVTTYRTPCSLISSNVALFAMPRRSREIRNSFHTNPKNISMHSVSLEVLGTGAEGGSSNVALVTNCGSYLINCGEGTSKMCGEYRIKLHKTPHIFITHPSWKNISGLVGMALSIQSSKGTNMYVYGDAEIGKLFSSVNKFINLKQLQVVLKNSTHNTEFSDGILFAKCVSLYPVTPDKIHGETSPSFTLEDDYKVAALGRNSGNFKCIDHSVSYIFTTAPTRGTLDLEKCIEFGVPVGPLLGQLKCGKDVTLPNGTLVKSKDVKAPDSPGPVIIAVECPTEDYLDYLLQESAFTEFQSSEKPAAAVVHFSKSYIVKNEKYQEWINRFPKSTLHLFINEDNKLFGSVAIHRQQYKLNLVHPEIFPLLHDTGIPDYPRIEGTRIPEGHVEVTQTPQKTPPFASMYTDEVFCKCESNSFISGETLCDVRLIPKMKFDYVRCMVLKREAYLNEIYGGHYTKEEIHQSLEEARKLEKEMKLSGDIYPKIVFLGTGSSKPSKVRNSSGILLYINSKDCVLFDCGEQTCGQLFLLYGKERTKEVLRNLQAVYISHMHVDHHLGLITILKERKLAFDELNESSEEEEVKKFKPIILLSPIDLFKWLEMFSSTFENISGLYNLIPNTEFLLHLRKLKDSIKFCLDTLGMESLNTVYVAHCPNSFGISMKHKDGWKVTYSGDTKPCEALIELGMNSDILIHEATLEDAYEHEAKLKMHSTTSQALDIGKRMNAKYILLTHFSQRYSCLPYISPSLSHLNVGIAFDFMEVPFCKLPVLPLLMKPLNYVFSKYADLVKTRTEMVIVKRGKEQGAKFDYSTVPYLEEVQPKRFKIGK